MLSFVSLCVVLLTGHQLRTHIRLLRRLYIPSCVVGALIALPVLAFLPAETCAQLSAGWGRLPGLLINIVFACLFIGVPIPTAKQVWQNANLQLAYGQIVAWGQYTIGVGLWLVMLRFIWPALPAMFGGILPVGFEGGHGTAGGLAPVFENLGWPEGKDFALTSATIGIVSAIIAGVALVNHATRKGYAERRKSPEEISEDESIGIFAPDERPVAGRLSVHSDSIDGLTLHICVVAMACLIGMAIKTALSFAGSFIPGEAARCILGAFPLFPLCMIGGLIVQKFEERFDKHKLIDLGLIRRIQNTALEFLVVAAIATIKISVVAKGILPLLILSAAGIAWNIFCVMFLARRVFKDCWFERAIAEMGQSMGVTATGLLLLRLVDPDYETNASSAFAYKQIAHEPFMGGGLWTGAAIPLLAMYGGMPVFLISLGAIILWLIIIAAIRSTGFQPVSHDSTP